MDWIALLVIVGIIFIIVAISRAQKSERPEESPYTKNRVLFSPSERSFLGVLEQVISEGYRVFGKVRIADVVSVRSMPDRSSWQRAFNRISAKHFDFVLCRSEDLAVIAAIELDDKSHNCKERQARDAFIVDLCKDIDLPLIQVPAQATYTVSKVREMVTSIINTSDINLQHHTPPQKYSLDSTSSAHPLGNPKPQETGPIDEEPNAPLCPRCSAPMVRRKAKTGANAGREFWGCSTFPKCRGIISLNNKE